MGKTIERNDPVIISCEKCLELNASSEVRCHKCGELIEGKKDES